MKTIVLTCIAVLTLSICYTQTSKPIKKKSTSTKSNKLNIPLVFVQGGTFTMGCTSEQGTKCANDEKPAHEVTLGNFSIAKYEVTQAQWQAVMGDNPSHFKGDNLPVDNVTWNDVQNYIQKLNTITGKNYRLPTEAEWEYVARGGNKTKGYIFSGSNNLNDVGWYGANAGKRSHQVGTKAANELGVYDMSGNVQEWCSDWFDDDYYSVSPDQNPLGSSKKESKVLRGGGWYNLSESTWSYRVSSRDRTGTQSTTEYIGFRLAQ